MAAVGGLRAELDETTARLRNQADPAGKPELAEASLRLRLRAARAWERMMSDLVAASQTGRGQEPHAGFVGGRPARSSAAPRYGEPLCGGSRIATAIPVRLRPARAATVRRRRTWLRRGVGRPTMWAATGLPVAAGACEKPDASGLQTCCRPRRPTVLAGEDRSRHTVELLDGAKRSCESSAGAPRALAASVALGPADGAGTA
jgi:hypothetical protein